MPIRSINLATGRAVAALALAALPAAGLFFSTNAPALAAEKTPAVLNWQASVDATQSATASPQNKKSIEIVNKINAYFNEMGIFKGRFIQTNPDNQKMKGRFYVKRPGMMRFDYSPPSKLRIVSNGRYLSIEDHDLKTVDRYPLDTTPFGILLAETVDLSRDANILEIAEGEDYLMINIEDKSEKTTGQIRLFFNKGKEFSLREWIITDPQGLNTKIEVGNLEADKELKTEFFALSNIDLQQILE